MLHTPAAEDLIAEACSLLLAKRFESLYVRIEDGWTASPLVIVTVRVRLWQWPWFDPPDLEMRLRSFLKLLSRDRLYRVRVDAE